MSKVLIVSPEFNCSEEILTIVAMLSGTCFFHVINMAHYIYWQFPIFGYDRITSGNQLMPRKKC
jgi:Helicase associated domain (HA2)